MPATPPPISHVSDTALWVAIYRAMESERPDALFHDPWARQLAGPQGEAIVQRMRKGRQFAWPMIVRTAVMDELLLRAIDHDGVDSVLNLAAGLDARPFRLPLPAELQWFDVDLPPMIARKRSLLDQETPRCRVEFLGADLAVASERARVMDRAASGGDRTLVITEGLLIYLEAGAVATLAEELAQRPPFAYWLSDLAGPRLLKMMARTWGKTLSDGNAEFKFAPAEGTAFFEPHGWREREFRSTWTESLRLGRTVPMAWLWNLVGKLAGRERREANLRMAGIVMLERAR